MELMSDPVMVATGHSYDRSCIQKWLEQGNRTCPVTGLRLRHLELTPNIALRNAIQVSSNSSSTIYQPVYILHGGLFMLYTLISSWVIACCLHLAWRSVHVVHTNIIVGCWNFSVGVGFSQWRAAQSARCSTANQLQA
jgi:F-box/WD-40 domain protein 7